MKAGFKVKSATFSAALREYSAATKKDEAKILNFAAGGVCIAAAKETPKASAAKIGRKLEANNYRLAGIILAKAGAYVGTTRAERLARAKAFVAKSKRSAAYIAAGWVKAGQAFGVLRARKVSAKGAHKESFGERATPVAVTTAVTIARLGNNAVGADTVGVAPLERALGGVAAKQLSKAREVMGGTARKFSAR